MKRIVTVILVVIMVFALSACAANKAEAPVTEAAEEAAEAEESAPEPEEEILIGVSYYTTEIPVLNSVLEALKNRAEQLGYKVVMAEGSMDINKQIGNVEDYIQMGCQVIFINPSDSAGITPAVEACNKAGIPVIMLDIDATGGERACHVTSDNELMGRYGGEYIAWKLNGKGKVALLDFPQLDIVVQRSDAFRKVMSYFPDIEIVATEQAVTRAEGLEKMEAIFQAHPDLDAVFAINDGGGLGAYYAGKAAGIDVAIAAVDAEDDAVELISEGTNYGLTSAHMAALFGKTAAEAADDIINGIEVEKKITIPVYPITVDSLDEYPGRDALEFDQTILIPRWYDTDSWKALVEEFGYTDWK